MYFSYAEITLPLWRSWRRRIAREQRHGTWLITLSDPQDMIMMRSSLALLSLRCVIDITHGDANSFEFLPE
jgi:hypothetical protein